MTTLVETPDGAQLALTYRAGPGPLVVFSHPHSGHRAVFDPLLARWQGQALTWDRRGYGASTKGADSLIRQEQDLARVLDHVGADRAVLVGLAAGGAVSVGFAGLAPDRVAGLVLVSSFMGQSGPAWFAATGETWPSGDAAMRELAPVFRATPRAAGWCATAQDTERSGAGDPPQPCQADMAMLADRRDVIIATGELDLMFTPKMLAEAGRRLPLARTEILPGVAHAGPYEDPDGFADWLDKVVPHP